LNVAKPLHLGRNSTSKSLLSSLHFLLFAVVCMSSLTSLQVSIYHLNIYATFTTRKAVV